MTLFGVVVVEGEIQRIEHCRYKREGDFEQERKEHKEVLKKLYNSILKIHVK